MSGHESSSDSDSSENSSKTTQPAKPSKPSKLMDSTSDSSENGNVDKTSQPTKPPPPMVSTSDSEDGNASQTTQHTQPLQDSQGDTRSQSKTDRIWRLRNASMRVLDFAVQTPGGPMVTKMEFTLKNGNKKVVDLPYTPDAMKNCKKIIVNKCEQYMWLEDLASEKQDKYFPDFVEQQIKLHDQTSNSADTFRKPRLELQKPSIEKLGDNFYWIAGAEEVHLLNAKRSDSLDFYAHKLTAEELEELPVEVIYVGIEKFAFLDDEKTALDMLLKIIMKMNLMQSPEFYSFPLASFCAHLSASLYKVLVEAHRSFSTTVVLSGTGNTPRTGKSLMTSMWQLALQGCWPKQLIKLTEATIFEELDKGRTVYCKYSFR